MKSNQFLKHYCKRYLFAVLLLLLASAVNSFGQTTLFSENFSSVTVAALPTGWTASSAIGVTSSTWVSNNTSSNQSSGYIGASAGQYLVVYNQNPSNNGIFNLTGNGFSTVGYTTIKVIYGARRSSSSAVDAILQWSTDGSNWNDQTFTSTLVTSPATWALVNNGLGINLPTGTEGQSNLRLRWKFTQSASNTTSNYSIDDVVVTGIGPSITATTSSFTPNFVSRLNNSSATSSFSISAAGLSQPFVITPPAGFKIKKSTDPSSSFAESPISISPSSGSVASTTIDVTYNPTAYGKVSSNIACSSTGAVTTNIAVTGTPAVQSIATGNWSSAATWEGGVVPTAAEDVYINAANPVTIDNASAECKSIFFDAAGTSGLITMGSAVSALSVYGDFALGNTTQKVFSDWPAGAKIKFKGGATQTLSGWTTSSSPTFATSMMEMVVDKTIGSKLKTAGADMKFSIGNSLEIISGTFELAKNDDIEAYTFSSGVATGSAPTITIRANGIFDSNSEENATSQTQFIRKYGASSALADEETIKIGVVTVYGKALFAPSSSNRINFSGLNIESGGIVEMPSIRGTSSSRLFNPGPVVIKTGGLFFQNTSATYWYNNTTTPTSITIKNGGEYEAGASASDFLNVNLVQESGSTFRYSSSSISPQVSSYKNLILSGTSAKTLAANITIDESLQLSGSFGTDNVPAARLSLGSYTLTYGSSAVLRYGTAGQTLSQIVSADEWPATAGPNSVQLYNTVGLTLSLPRTIATTLTLTNGVLTHGGNLSIASGGTISRAIGTLATAPNFGTTANLVYTSSTQKVTTGVELPPASGNILQHLTINTSQGIIAGSDINCTGTLTLTNGIADLGANNLTAAAVSGGSATSYINTDGVGLFTIKNIAATPTSFPVGNSSYTPVSITNAGTADNFSLNVSNVLPSFVPATSVNKIWKITEGTPGGSDASITLQWNAADQHSSFSPANSAVIKCGSAAIDFMGTLGAASGSGPYTKVLTGLNTLSSFGVTNSMNDVSITGLVSPVTGGCKTSTQALTVTLKNEGAAPIDFSQNNVTVSATATGGYSSSIVLSTGTLAAGAIQNVTLPATIDLSVAGSYVFNASASVAGDVTAGNDAMSAATIVAAAQPAATISYAGTPFCKTTASGLSASIVGSTGGSFSAGAGLTIDNTTGAITPSTSTAGAYTVAYSIAAANGCAAVNASTSVTIHPLKDATFDYGSASTFCQTGGNPIANITGTAGGAFTASPAGLSINASTGEINSAASSLNSYTVTYTSTGPCAVSSSLNITVTLAPSAGFSYTNVSYCSNATNPAPTFSAGASSGVFSATPSGLVFVSTSTGEVNLAASAAGTYTITNFIASAGGCAAATASTTLTVTQLPSPTISYTTAPYCISTNTNQTVTRTGTIGGVFTAPTGLTINSASGNILPSTSTAGTYLVNYTIAATGGCAAVTASTSVSVNAVPSATITYTGAPFCNTLSTGQSVTFAGNTGGSYTASPAGLSINSTSGQIVPSTSTPGTYLVAYNIVAAGGCAAYSTSASVIVTALPVATIGYASSTYCISMTTAQSASKTGTPTGAFSAPTGLTINSSTGEITPSSSTEGTYLVTYSIAAAAGCASVTTSTTVTINALPAATISYTGAPFCNTLSAGQSVTFAGSIGGAYSATPAGISINSSTGQIIPSTSTPGVYTIAYNIPAGGGCPAYATSTSVKVTALPVATINYTGTPYCASIGSAQPVTQTGAAGGVFSASTGLALNTSTGAITPSSSTVGTYPITYTIAAAAGCAAVTANTSVVVSAVPTASVTYSGSPFCSSITTAQSTSLTGTTGGGFSATPAGLIINASTGAIIPSTSTAGTYSVKYAIPASAACPSTTVTATAIVTAAPAATINYVATPYCSNGGTATVTATGSTGGVYSSTTGLVINATTGEINLATSTSGTYLVTYTVAAANGCALFKTTAPITINQISLPATSITSSAASFCGPTSVNLSVQGGTLAPGASWVWYSGSCGGTKIGTGASLSAVAVAATTTFYVRAEGAVCGNTTCVSTTVTINTIPAIVVDALGDTVLNPGKRVTLMATVTPPAFTHLYTWYKAGVTVVGANSNSLIVDVDNLATYTAKITTIEGCSATSAAKKISSVTSDLLWVSPNPTNGPFKVRYYSRATVFNFSRTLLVFDERGRQVYSKSYPITGPYSNMEVDFTSKNKGTYFLFILKANGERLSYGKVIIQ